MATHKRRAPIPPILTRTASIRYRRLESIDIDSEELAELRALIARKTKEMKLRRSL
jgi:hypothetical protein